jgi:hypothetical protein
VIHLQHDPASHNKFLTRMNAASQAHTGFVPTKPATFNARQSNDPVKPLLRGAPKMNSFTAVGGETTELQISTKSLLDSTQASVPGLPTKCDLLAFSHEGVARFRSNCCGEGFRN